MWLTIRIAVGHELHRPPASVLFLGTPAALHEFGNLPHVVARVPRKGFHSRLVGELRSLVTVEQFVGRIIVRNCDAEVLPVRAPWRCPCYFRVDAAGAIAADAAELNDLGAHVRASVNFTSVPSSASSVHE